MLPALSQVCSLHSSLEEDVKDFAEGHCRALEIWFTKLENHLQDHSISDTKKLLERHEMQTPVASYQGGLFDTQGEARREHWESFGRRLELCRQFEIPTLVVACDVATPLSQQSLARVQHSLSEVARQGEQQDVRIAIEFQAGSVIGNNLQTIAALVSETASCKLGICFDAFHFFVGPSKLEDLDLLDSDNLFHVQLCDLGDVPREFAKDADRILPGDGHIPLDPIVERLHQIQYEAAVSVEILNPQIWEIPARQFGEIAMIALRRQLEHNS